MYGRGFQPLNNGFPYSPPIGQGQFGFGVPIPGSHFGGVPIGHPAGFHPPANFHVVPFGGQAPVRVLSPMPAQQAIFQPQPEMMMMPNGLMGTRIPNVRAHHPDVVNQAPVFNSAPLPNDLLPSIPDAPQAGGFSPPPVVQSPGGPQQSGDQARGLPQQAPGSLDLDETQRKNLYSISYFPSSDPVAQNTQLQKTPSNTSRIFHEYRSASRDKVSPEDFIANYYGNGDSNSDGSPLVKICKMDLATPIKIGSCVIVGERNYIDINEGGNKTRIHIDNEGARDLENYRILVKEELGLYRNSFDFKSLDQNKFKELKSVDEFNDFCHSDLHIYQVGQSINDDKILDAFVDTFISNHLKAGRFYTETIENGNNHNKKPFAYVKIERPISNDKKINVTFSDKHSAQLNSININAGKNSKDEEVFFQLSLEEKDDKQVIAKDSLKFFTKNKDGTFKEEKMEKGVFWGFKNINELGDAKDKIINIYTHKEEDDQPTLKYKIKRGKFDKDRWPKKDSTVEETHRHQKVKCGEANDFTDHEFMNAQSRSTSPQTGARGELQSPDHVAGGGMEVRSLVASSPIPMMGAPAQAPMMGVQAQMTIMGAPMGMPMMGGGQQVPMMGALGQMPMMMGGGPPPAPAPMMGMPMMRPAQEALQAGVRPPMVVIPKTSCCPIGDGKQMQLGGVYHGSA